MTKGRNWTAVDSDELWEGARQQQAHYPESDGEWVPKQAVDVRLDILPRREKVADRATVEHYRDIYETLPPITVQRDTFVLIDGMHRFTASPSDYVRIVEVDVPDEDLRLAAFRANAKTGRPLTIQERIDHMQWLLKHHPEWSDALIGRECGVSARTVLRHRQRIGERAQPMTKSQVETRIGVDGRKRQVPPKAPKPVVSSFDPGASDGFADDFEPDPQPAAPEPVTHTSELARELLGGGSDPVVPPDEVSAEAMAHGRAVAERYGLVDDPSLSEAADPDEEDGDPPEMLLPFSFVEQGIRISVTVQVFASTPGGSEAFEEGRRRAIAYLSSLTYANGGVS